MAQKTKPVILPETLVNKIRFIAKEENLTTSKYLIRVLTPFIDKEFMAKISKTIDIQEYQNENQSDKQKSIPQGSNLASDPYQPL